MTDTHEIYMQRCLELASAGLGLTAPNPMVGAVILYNDRIIGEGYHTGYGKPHAEVEAISRVADPSLLRESTLYVNLEPCNHHGKTPPCTDLILKMGIPRVVIGQTDTNLIAGGGVERLRQNGVEVITGVLESESRYLNRRFNSFHEKKRPYLILKWAQTTDGFVDAIRGGAQNPSPRWITDETCRRLVHKWRSEEQAILAGSGTILLDNPKLNVRVWSGKDPVRLSIDRRGRLIGGNSAILDGTIPSIIYTETESTSKPNLDFVRLYPDQPVWDQVMEDLYQREIQSVLIEGGPILFASLIAENLWDEARVFVGPGWFGAGVRAPEFPYKPAQRERIGGAELFYFNSLGV